ncbi:hypothetical protein [Paenibacillus motobuensis]|uniref:Uncharacterized protein n=1 Tax=Paenibacillus motobuensis TaxID=295324 RepID=A0ABP3I0R6_9BACL
MKRAEWLIAAVIIAMGLICMLVSANMSRDMSILQIVRTMSKYCLKMMAVAGLIGGVYYLVNRSNRQ